MKLAKEDIVDADKDDWLGRESGLKFGGFRSKIYLETQCTSKPSKGEILCSGCQKNFGKHDVAKWTAWKGLIGEAPPPKCRFIRSDYSNASYEAWGEAPRSGPSSAKKSSAGEPAVKKEPVKKAEPKPKAKKEAKPSNAAAVAPAPAAEPKKLVISIPDDLVENSELQCFINSEGVCFYSDFDEDTLDSIPDMSRIIGSIPKGKDRETATKADFTEAAEPEEQADE